METGVGARLNLGCGDDIQQGYLNIDIRKTHPNVIQVDLSQLPWPFANRSAKEILMLDFLEHFPYSKTVPILFECYRALDKDGELVIQVPDFEHLSLALNKRGGYLCNICGSQMQEYGVNQPACANGHDANDIAEAAMQRLYGGQDYPGNFHMTCFTKESLERKAAQVGLELVGYEEEAHQWANWNFKARFRKGAVW